jgi:hypothetical protein
MKLLAYRAELPGNITMISQSALLPAYKAGGPVDLPARETRQWLWDSLFDKANIS